MAQVLIKSETYNLPFDEALVAGWLKDLRNFEQLMPEGKVSNWKADENSCSFIIKGMSSLGMERHPQPGPHEVRYKSTTQSPIKFDLFARMTTLPDGHCEVRFELETDMSPFVKMMAEKPLTAFFDAMASKIGAQLEATRST
ncbi:MAG: hypothetical protein KDD36_10420 [Flavobacteriales bacterium]|nr:hypothetical protein [Flavobacteriales bacterium]